MTQRNVIKLLTITFQKQNPQLSHLLTKNLFQKPKNCPINHANKGFQKITKKQRGT